MNGGGSASGTGDTFDVIVAGAGPAGSRVARDLAARGLAVALLEEHREVGIPCHCSGLVTPRTLERAAVGDDIVLNSIRGAEFRLPSGRRLTVGGDRVHALVIDRVELDRRVAAQAVDAGASLLTRTRLLEYRLSGRTVAGGPDDGVVASVVRDGVQTELRARILVGADGARSRVAAQLHGRRREGLVAGLGAVVTGVPSVPTDHVRVFLDADAAPGWFGWSIPLGDGSVRIGTGSSGGLSVGESLARLGRRFPDTFADAVVQHRTSGAIALWQPTRLVGDRVILVGDAARQVKPTSGGGVHAALFAAELAAKHARNALDTGDCSARGLRAYDREWHATLGREMRRGYDLRRVFERLTVGRLERLFDALEQPALRGTIDRVGDIDFPSRVAWAIARHDPRLAVSLATMPRFPMAWLG